MTAPLRRCNSSPGATAVSKKAHMDTKQTIRFMFGNSLISSELSTSPDSIAVETLLPTWMLAERSKFRAGRRRLLVGQRFDRVLPRCLERWVKRSQERPDERNCRYAYHVFHEDADRDERKAVLQHRLA